MTLEISITEGARILAAAAASPNEVCGLLLGRGNRVLAVRDCANVAGDPARHFEIDPAALIAAHREARAGGFAVIGHYHSHPGGDPAPSRTDAREAASDRAYWIIVAGDVMTAWHAVPDGVVHGRFDPITIHACADSEASPEGGDPFASKDSAHMTISPVDFASLLCSRLCHDLLSPVGALNNGLELLADETDPEMRQRCMELLNESARVSANKLKFFRLAFGAAGGFGERIDPREARGAIEGLLGDKKVTLDWMVELDGMSKSGVKILLNLAMIAGDTLVRGGNLTIGAEENDGVVEIVLRAEGPRVVLDAELRATLVDGAEGDAVTARAAGAYLVHALAAEAGGSVMVTEPSEGALLFGATLPGA